MSDLITSILPEPQPIVVNEQMAAVGQVANVAAGHAVFNKYRSGKSRNTLQRHAHDLHAFATYLEVVSIPADAEQLAHIPTAWSGLTWGLVEGFLHWQLKQGYAVSTANARLSTVKVYAGLALKAGAIARDEGLLIQTVRGYSLQEGVNLDAQRTVTRLGNKKAAPIMLSETQAEALKHEHKDTPRGARNRLLMCLLLDHGLRASEAIAITQTGFDFDERTLTFFRPKTKQWTNHRLTADTLIAALRYKEYMPDEGPILRGATKGGLLTDSLLDRITLSRTVRRLGKQRSIYRVEQVPSQRENRETYNRRRGTLSAHDCRHYCATTMAKKGYSVKKLMDWFGWTSPAMALRYVESTEIHERDME